MMRIKSRIISHLCQVILGVELNGHKYTLDAADAAVVAVNMDCPPHGCVIDM